MKVWIYSLVFAVSSLAVSSQTCPSDHFSVIFVGTIETILDELAIDIPDPELSYFKNVLKFRDEEIVHFFEDAVYFFKNTFGLDFSMSPPTDQHQLFYENATISPFILSEDIVYTATSNNWIRTGSTHSSCYRIRDGGVNITFSGEQTLYGSYGGTEGKTVGPTSALAYGFYIIDVCQQSPLLIQFLTTTPFPVGSVIIINPVLYNNVLGYGKSQGVGFIRPDPQQPDKFRLSFSNVFTFPAE